MQANKVLVIGIDGVSYDLLGSFLARGLMPNLSRIVREGSLRRMNSTIPEVSSTAWTTFMTGMNPGNHGIFGFMDFENRSRKIYFPNSESIQSPTLWETLGKYDKKSIVINLPSTYPARPIHGILTAGFVAIDLKKATYPEAAYDYLKSMGYRLDVDVAKASVSLAALFDDICLTLEKRIEAIFHFLDSEWDLFIGVITETDRLHHFMWSAAHEGNEFNTQFLDFYKRIDLFIGEMQRRAVEKYGDNLSILIVSDHGFADIKQEVYVNAFLTEKGYLSFGSASPRSLEEVHPESKAFALDPSRIYVNAEDRFSGGCVSRDDYQNVREELRNAFLSLTYDGEPVIKKVFMKEELYSGTCFERAPDLVLLANRGFDLKGAVNKKSVFGKGAFTGTHVQDDAVFILHDGKRHDLLPDVIDITDIAPTIFHLLSIRDVQVDGRSLAGIR